MPCNGVQDARCTSCTVGPVERRGTLLQSGVAFGRLGTSPAHSKHLEYRIILGSILYILYYYIVFWFYLFCNLWALSSGL